jgi:RHH-type proline utilization regulon transcriptional repressor/proline dehydrogenase/delta 1-pyrroline-5-carboxylate dehydrogenase
MNSNNENIEANISQQGALFFEQLRQGQFSLFCFKYWMGKASDRALESETLKTKLFEFVQALPEFSTKEELYCYLHEHFLGEDVPGWMRFCIKLAGAMGAFGKKITQIVSLLAVRCAARQFIIGSRPGETIRKLKKLRNKGGYAFTLDILGEETRCQQHVDDYVDGYIEILENLKQELSSWKALGSSHQSMDWGDSPKVNISIKPSALCVNAEKIPPDDAVQASRRVGRLSVY